MPYPPLLIGLGVGAFVMGALALVPHGRIQVATNVLVAPTLTRPCRCGPDGQAQAVAKPQRGPAGPVDGLPGNATARLRLAL